MIKRIYDGKGYLNFDTLFQYNLFMYFIIGARGIGKTYNAIRYAIDHGINTIYVRRTADESKAASGKDTNIFNELCQNENRYFARPKGQEIPIYHIYPKHTTKDNIEGIDPDCKIAFASLTTFHKVRSISFHDYNLIVYDEFIPEKIVHKMKHEADAYNNMIETVNRNRELTGAKPITVMCLSNSNNIYNEILAHYNMIKHIVRMQKQGEEIYIDRDRSIGVIYPLHSPISEQKKETALYKALHGTDYEKMALSNDFEAHLDLPYIKSQPLKEYVPKIQLGELTYYEHKKEFRAYVTFHYSGTVKKLDVTDTNVKYFLQTGIGKLVTFTLFCNECFFEDETAYLLHKQYLSLK